MLPYIYSSHQFSWILSNPFFTSASEAGLKKASRESYTDREWRGCKKLQPQERRVAQCRLIKARCRQNRILALGENTEQTSSCCLSSLSRQWHQSTTSLGFERFSWGPFGFYVFLKCLRQRFSTQVALPPRRCILNLWDSFFIVTVIQKTSLAFGRRHTGQSCTTKNCPESHDFCPVLLSNIQVDIHGATKSVYNHLSLDPNTALCKRDYFTQF